MTNRGSLLTIEGTFEGDGLTLQGSQRSRDGKAELLRGTWKPEGGGVRETARTSADGGKAWRPLFDILFRPHAERKG